MANTSWDDFCKSVDRFAQKANRKIEELSETAAVKLKISAKKGELEEEYGKLGKLTYEHNCAKDENDSSVAACIARITALREEIAALEAKAAPRTQAEFEGEAEESSNDADA